MSLDPKISQAIKEAVEHSGQSSALARLITAWMQSVTSGNEDPADQSAAARHLEVLYAETVVDDTDGKDGD